MQPFTIHLEEKTPIDLVMKEASKIKSEVIREQVIKLISSKKSIPINAVRKEVENNTLNQDKHKTDTTVDNYTEEEIKKARDLLASRYLIERFLIFMNKSGYVGENRNKTLTYLACTSRLLPGKGKAISIIAEGDSGSGKSALIIKILKLIPNEEWKDYTFISEKALIHNEEDFSHKILFIYEREGGKYADYTLRTAKSEEKLSILTTIKNKETGKFETQDKEVSAEGMVIFETTTDDNIEPQNANRTFEFFTDNSSNQTRSVLRSQAEDYTRNFEALEIEYRIWRCAQELLERLPVHVPYAEKLAEQFPTDRVRARRDFPRLLSLIEASALLHQKQRKRIRRNEKEYILASKKDFDIAFNIVKPILSQTYKKVNPKEQTLVEIIKEDIGFGSFDPMGLNHINAFSLKSLREIIGDRIKNNDKKAIQFQADSTLRGYLKKLSKKEILDWNGKMGAASEYVLVQDIKDVTINLSIS